MGVTEPGGGEARESTGLGQNNSQADVGCVLTGCIVNAKYLVGLQFFIIVSTYIRNQAVQT